MIGDKLVLKDKKNEVLQQEFSDPEQHNQSANLLLQENILEKRNECENAIEQIRLKTQLTPTYCKACVNFITPQLESQMAKVEELGEQQKCRGNKVKLQRTASYTVGLPRYEGEVEVMHRLKQCDKDVTIPKTTIQDQLRTRREVNLLLEEHELRTDNQTPGLKNDHLMGSQLV